MTTFNQRTLGKSHLTAMLATMLVGYGMVYDGAPTKRTPRRKTNTHPMITASDLEISEWNRLVNTRQIIRAQIKPWKSIQRRWKWERHQGGL